MCVRFLRLVACVWVGLAVLAVAVRASDAFPGTTLSGTSGAIAGTTVGMTGQTGEPNFIGGNTTSDWYSWTAPSSGLFTIGTCNLASETVTNTDTTLAAYTGAAVGSLAAVATNDDTTGCNSTVNASYGSFLSFTATAGTTYRFQVDTYSSGTTGTFTLRWGLSALTVAVTDASATEGGDTAAFTVRPASPPAGSSAVTVTIGTSTQCTFSPSTLTFTSANFATPQTVTVTATNDASAEGTHSCAPASITAAGTGYAGITGAPPTLTIYDNDSPNFTIAKSVSAASIAAPGTLTYTITVDNNGTAVLTSPVISDTLRINGSALTPTSGPTLTSGDSNSDGIVQDTETWVYTVTYAVTQANIDTGGSITNFATWSCAQVAAKNSSTVTTTITQTPAFSISKTQSSGPSPITAAGQAIGYTITVTNTGNVTLNGLSLSDTLALGSGARTLTTGPTLSSGDADSDGQIDVGETWTYAASYTVPLADMNSTGSYANSATFDTAQTAPLTSATVTTNVTRTATINLDKTFAITTDNGTPGLADPGDIITYYYNVTNTGNVTVNNISVADLHDGTGTPPVPAPASIASLNPAASYQFTATYQVTQRDVDNQ